MSVDADTIRGKEALQHVESLIAQGLAIAWNACEDGPIHPPDYVRTFLAEHVRAGDVWEALGGTADLLDALDPGRVAAEAFRSARPVADLPVGVAATIVTVSVFSDMKLDRRGRDLVRALGAIRLRHPLAAFTPPVIWANLRPVHPHLPLTAHTRGVSGCAFGTRPDGTLLLATTGWDETVRLWDPGTGAPVGDALTGHTAKVTGCAFGTRPDGTLLLATTSNDKTVRLWNPATGTPVGEPLTGHTGPVTGCAFGTRPDGTVLLVTTSNDKTVRLWEPHYRLVEGTLASAPSVPMCLTWHGAVAVVGCSDGILALDSLALG